MSDEWLQLACINKKHPTIFIAGCEIDIYIKLLGFVAFYNLAITNSKNRSKELFYT